MFTMSCLKDYRDRVHLLSRKKISVERRNLFFMLNGDVFFPVKSWPKDVRRIFRRKPIGNTDCFKRMSSGFRSEMDSIKPNMGTREDRDSLTSFLTMKTQKETPGSTSMWTTTSCCFSTVFLTRSNACPRGPEK